MSPLSNYTKITYVIHNNCSFDSAIVDIAVTHVDYVRYAYFIDRLTN